MIRKATKQDLKLIHAWLVEQNSAGVRDNFLCNWELTVKSQSEGKLLVYTDRFAYLEQYFEKAYTIGTNGVATTNSAGVLSPYGEFLPTMPGPAALVTMPDIDTGQRGTGVVNVVKLQLDVNHDGVMNLSFAGPDNTSQANPMRFWVNGDDDHEGVGADRENFKYKDGDVGRIRSQRNLEDFARLWIIGVPMVSRSRTKAIGASENIHGIVGSSVDLFNSFGFGNTRDEHSAEFKRPIQTALPFFNQILDSTLP